MKKYYFPVILCFLLFFPFNLESKQLFVKMSFGLTPWGEMHDAWFTTTDYYAYSTTPAGRARPGLDISIEFIYQINSNIGFSFGTGYFSKSLYGNPGQFVTPPDTGDFVGTFSYTPELASDIYPLYLSGIFSFPVMSKVKWNFLGGMGYYFARIRCKNVDKTAEGTGTAPLWNYVGWKLESNSGAVGYFVGTCLDFDLSLNMFLSVEALYRSLNFKRLKTSSLTYTQIISIRISREVNLDQAEENVRELVDDSTFFYLQRVLGNENQGDIDYRVSGFDCSGFLFRIGIKFRF